MVEIKKTITIYSTRGGNGKTLTSIFLAIAAAKRGLKTLIIDADLEAPSLMHLLKPDNLDLTWVDFLEEKIDDVMLLPVKSSIDNLYIIYSPPPKVGKSFLGWKAKDWWTGALKRSIEGEQTLHDNGYNLIIVDNQSGTSLNSVNNMVLADTSVMVIRPSTYGLGAASSFIGEMYRVLREIKPRSDYFIWNQVHTPPGKAEQLILSTFLDKWNNNLENHGIKNGGNIKFNTKLNLGLLSENPNLEEYYDEVLNPISKLLELVLADTE